MDVVSPSESEPSKCPAQGFIKRFKDLSIFLWLRKVPPKTLDSGIDWNTHCTAIHEKIFSQDHFFEPLFDKMIHHAKDRKAWCKEALWYWLFDLGQKWNNYWYLLWNNIIKEQEEEWNFGFRKTRFEQLAKVWIMNFQRFFEQIVFDLFDQEKSWQEIEQVLINSSASFLDVGMSDAANEVMSSATKFQLDDRPNTIQMCPFSWSDILPDIISKYKEKVYTGCMLLGAKWIKWKTVLEDFLIIMAMITYQYESWKKTHSTEIKFVDLK